MLGLVLNPRVSPDLPGLWNPGRPSAHTSIEVDTALPTPRKYRLTMPETAKEPTPFPKGDDMIQDPPVPHGLPIEREDRYSPSPPLTVLRQRRPMSRLNYPDGHLGWLITNYELTRSVLSNPAFSSHPERMANPIGTGRVVLAESTTPQPGVFLRMDPPDHTRLRRRLTGVFTVRRMRQLEPRVTQIVRAQLDELERQGSGADLVEHFAIPVPSLVICELLGVPYEDRGSFQSDTAGFLRVEASAEERVQLIGNINAYLAELVDRKLVEPTDDLLSDLTRSGDLTRDELVGIAFLLLFAGHETTANMLGLGALALLEHPEQLRLLRSEPELIDNAVEEMLRFLSILHVGPLRTAGADIELGGNLIREGENILISLPAANRDPARFDNPEELDFHRKATGHLAFGHGIHQCLGQQLARTEMRIGWTELFGRLPNLRLAVDPDEIPLRTDMVIYGVHRLPVEW
ncbi:cytochrome P450 [Stackebrandtia endophytica]|uniref:Cytochrome P450 n=2 Tax=Stackebrandtia endophytica TaxID=1496996 RepID=A0A543AY04_9ACTN|nr:cytochrome P450 [Stackebrandtia endophytica]